MFSFHILFILKIIYLSHFLLAFRKKKIPSLYLLDVHALSYSRAMRSLLSIPHDETAKLFMFLFHLSHIDWNWIKHDHMHRYVDNLIHMQYDIIKWYHHHLRLFWSTSSSSWKKFSYLYIIYMKLISNIHVLFTKPIFCWRTTCLSEKTFLNKFWVLAVKMNYFFGLKLYLIVWPYEIVSITMPGQTSVSNPIQILAGNLHFFI